MLAGAALLNQVAQWKLKGAGLAPHIAPLEAYPSDLSTTTFTLDVFTTGLKEPRLPANLFLNGDPLIFHSTSNHLYPE
jgi:hypothetical protein